MERPLAFAAAILALTLPYGVPAASRGSSNYYGKLIGPLTEYAHGIRGTAYAVDESTIFIKGFSYDGTGPDAFFWVGNTSRPSPDGYIVPYPDDYKGREPPMLKAYNNTDVILRLPGGKRIRDIKWLSVWCRRFTVNFGEVFIPLGLEVPKARVLPEFKRLAHGLRSGNISVLDAKTFYIPNLHYDGAGPDAYFWVGNGTEPSPLGIKVPNEIGSLDPLRGYQGEDIEIQLPGNLTVYDIDWLAVWCVQYRHNFGHVLIPKDLDVPPALGQTKITTSSTAPAPGDVEEVGSGNCRQLLGDRLQVRWQMMADGVQVQLDARIREDQYVAFGLSGEQGRSTMVGGDVVVAFYDASTGQFRADDYYMSATAQCDGQNGVCPDERLGGRNDVVVVSGRRTRGVTTVVYKRPLRTNEPVHDRAIPSQGAVSVIAAIGPLNTRKEANAHAPTDKTADDIRIDFSSRDDNDCVISPSDVTEAPTIQPWPVEKILGETQFTARIGPTGGKRGYTPITGHPSWGIAWYINDRLIPEITVERGQTYTFMVEGGNDRTNPARYHPFYITDSDEGGFGQKSEEDQKEQRVFAGVGYDAEGYPYPTAAGRYCEWTHKTIDKSAETETFEEFLKTLRLVCDDGAPAYLNWTVDEETPDLVYYQCYTHNNLGWKIHVVDRGRWSQQNGTNSGTVVVPSLVLLIAVLLNTILLFQR
ncbi:protein Skeletor, isoforms B/C [Schistocerca americana]|uniref:protein Skeletor, isoforms B/C n=1 Tax=Schistocerca americana TaxID=7009 RepID=UPI001F4F2488|nr:protein Skeletor, isoforms B/C [Schistocerca americana]XP_049956932.1 protein Skeletor, isoforms B/C [Schistocerca serialis cubense]